MDFVVSEPTVGLFNKDGSNINVLMNGAFRDLQIEMIKNA